MVPAHDEGEPFLDSATYGITLSRSIDLVAGTARRAHHFHLNCYAFGVSRLGELREPVGGQDHIVRGLAKPGRIGPNRR